MRKWSIWLLLTILTVGILVWSIKILCVNDSPDKGYKMSEKLIKELHAIDRKAEEMATSVLKNPLLRGVLGEKSEILEERLLCLAEELERLDSAAYEIAADQVSEALLDLVFVQMETNEVSLRLGQVIEQKRLKDQQDEKDVPKDK